MSVFEITNKNSGQVIDRIEAPTRRAALAHSRSELEARELSSKEIVEVVQAGKAITEIDAAAGESGGAQE